SIRSGPARPAGTPPPARQPHPLPSRLCFSKCRKIKLALASGVQFTPPVVRTSSHDLINSTATSPPSAKKNPHPPQHGGWGLSPGPILDPRQHLIVNGFRLFDRLSPVVIL